MIRKERLMLTDRLNKKSKEILGCNKVELFNHLKQTFEYNYKIKYNDIYFNDLHIDHIIPISSGKNEQDFIKLNHYTNLQFLHKDHNMQKKDKLDYVIPKFPIEDYKE